MGNRLTKIYTRTGDEGSSSMSDGVRLQKDATCFHALGDLDELNSLVGLLVTRLNADNHKGSLNSIQHDLFNIGGELSSSGACALDESRVTWLEEQIDDVNSCLPPLKEFILPGGSETAALSHLARTVCRRAERKLVALSQGQAVRPLILVYINRLSDYFFILARQLNHEQGVDDVYWKSKRAQ